MVLCVDRLSFLHDPVFYVSFFVVFPIPKEFCKYLRIKGKIESPGGSGATWCVCVCVCVYTHVSVCVNSVCEQCM